MCQIAKKMSMHQVVPPLNDSQHGKEFLGGHGSDCFDKNQLKNHPGSSGGGGGEGLEGTGLKGGLVRFPVLLSESAGWYRSDPTKSHMPSTLNRISAKGRTRNVAAVWLPCRLG